MTECARREPERHGPGMMGLHVAAAFLSLSLMVIALLAWAADPPSRPAPYSCRQLLDEQRKCAFLSCDKRVIERLRRECLRDGGRTVDEPGGVLRAHVQAEPLVP